VRLVQALKLIPFPLKAPAEQTSLKTLEQLNSPCSVCPCESNVRETLSFQLATLRVLFKWIKYKYIKGNVFSVRNTVGWNMTFYSLVERYRRFGQHTASLKSTIFWDVTPCSPLSQPTFRRKISPPSSGSKNKLSKKLTWKVIILRPWRWRRCSSETSVDSQRTTWRYIQEDGTLHNHRCEYLSSYILPPCSESKSKQQDHVFSVTSDSALQMNR
jgi:hypothetical protein